MPAKIQQVLLVDDDPCCCQLMERTVRSCGYYRVQALRNGADCLARIPNEPTLILLDYPVSNVVRPNMLRAIKCISPTSYIVLLGSEPEVQIAVDALHGGAFDYVVKDERLDKYLVALLAGFEQG
ncbi:MAG: response regulator [Hymenobacter sp.]|nr:MAG: response regulator [Hymenobacter sp.]